MALDIAALRAEIDTRNQEKPFSGVIFIRDHKETILAEGFGFANKAEEIPNTLRTRFGIASGAKIFTAVSICQLVEQGKLSFDTLLKDCLEIPFPEFDPAITIRHLLTHSSGIPDYFDEEVIDDYEMLWREKPNYTFREPHDFLQLFQDSPMKFAPGERYSYNNAGFVVLGLVVEQTSGQEFTEYVTQNIFAKAGMSECGYFATDRLPARIAYGYLPAGEGEWRTNIFAVPLIGGPDGGVFITVGDIAKFWDSLFGFKLLDEATTTTMLKPHIRTDKSKDNDIFYGLGVYIHLREGNPFAYSVEGSDPGVEFYSTVFPDKQIEYTITSNTNSNLWPFGLIRRAAREA